MQTSREPILINGAKVSAAVVAVIALLRAAGVPIDDELNAAITGVVAAVVIPLATWWLARQQTVTIEKANNALHDASAGKQVTPFRAGQS